MSTEQNTVPRKPPQLPEDWLEVIGDEFEKPYMNDLKRFLLEEKQRHTVYPPGPLMFNAFQLTPFNQVRVVVLGQDPYHGPRQAHGLSFSVMRGINPPPSLRNIFKELNDSLQVPISAHGELTAWAEQGVLMLNTILSVRARKPRSHANQGWEIFTDRVIDELNDKRDGLIFVLWGRNARNKATRIDRSKHMILESPHPSPHSADYGFFGCNHFVKINDHLQEKGQEPIVWALPQ